MYIIASFKYSEELEVAVTEIERLGIVKHNILVLPLEKSYGRAIDSMNYSVGRRSFDLAAILGAIFMLLGSIYGFVLSWGPIIWASIGLVFGIFLGFLIDYYYSKYKGEKKLANEHFTEVFVMTLCKANQADQVKTILWEQQALGLCTYTGNTEH